MISHLRVPTKLQWEGASTYFSKASFALVSRP